jgi:hypothetical protein
MVQVIQEQTKEQRILDKAQVIAASKKVRRTSNRLIWIVGSGNPQIPNKFYRVMYDEDLDEIVCDCKAYQFGMTVPCCHILAAVISLGNGDV